MNLLKAMSVLLLVSSITQAKIFKGREGGGGNGVVCFQAVSMEIRGEKINILDEIKKNKNTIPDIYLSWIESIEMFDLFSAKKKRGLGQENPNIINIRESEGIYEYIDRVSNRFVLTNRQMKNLIKHGRKLIPNHNIVMHDYAVKYHNDLGTVTLPSEKCIISTIAAQVNNGDFVEVHIDERLFFHPKHSKLSQAVLIMHELLYAVGRKFKHKNSRPTRNLVRFYISSHSKFTERYMMDSLINLNFNQWENDEIYPDDSSELRKFRNSEIMNHFVTKFKDIEFLLEEYILDYFNLEKGNQKFVKLFDEVNKRYQKIKCAPEYCHVSIMSPMDTLHNMLMEIEDDISRKEFRNWVNRAYESLEEFKGYLNFKFEKQYHRLAREMEEETQISNEDLELLVPNFMYIKQRFVESRIRFNGHMGPGVSSTMGAARKNSLIYPQLVKRERFFYEGELYEFIPLKLNNIISK